MREILKSAFIKYLSNPDVMDKIFFTTASGYYGRNTPIPTKILENVISSIDFSGECKEITDTFKESIINNNKEIIGNVVIRAFSRIIARNILADNWLESSINATIASKTYELIQSQQNN